MFPLGKTVCNDLIFVEAICSASGCPLFTLRIMITRTSICPSIQLMYTAHRHGMVIPLAYPSKLVVDPAAGDRRENTGVNQAEGIPLGCTFSLKVPPKPPLRFLLECRNLGFNVASGIILVRLRPLVDVVLEAAIADEGAAG
jgi:hypothetical protein